jgi:hypothetical protein
MSHDSQESTATCVQTQDQDRMPDLQVRIDHSSHITNVLWLTVTATAELDVSNVMNTAPYVADALRRVVIVCSTIRQRSRRML